MQKPIGLGWDGALCSCTGAVPNTGGRVRGENEPKCCVMGLQESGLAQSERAASRPDLSTHLAEKQHAALPPKEPLFPL